MQRHRYISSLIAIAALLLVPQTLRAEGDTTRPSYIAPRTAQSWLEQGQQVSFLDVREAKEFIAGHIGGARNIPFDEVEQHLAEFPETQPIVVYCIHSSHRAPAAAKMLRKAGRSNVYVLEGGIVEWEVDGLPIQASDLAKAPEILPLGRECEAKVKAWEERSGTWKN